MCVKRAKSLSLMSVSAGRTEGRGDLEIPNPQCSWSRPIRQSGSLIRTRLNGSRGGEQRREDREEEEEEERNSTAEKCHKFIGANVMYMCVSVSVCGCGSV